MTDELPIPNRWHTTVSVEVYINGQMRHIKWFSDLQMAYIWIANQERDNNEPLNYNRNFVELANAMDRRWQQRPNEGCTIARSYSYKYKATYEPDVSYRPGDQSPTRRQNIQLIQPLTITDNRQNNQIQFVFHP